MSCLLLAEEAVSVSCWDKTSVIIAGISLIISTALTILIIIQTFKNAKETKQQAKRTEEISIKIAEKDVEYANLQVKLAQRKDKRKAFATLLSCYRLCEAIVAFEKILPKKNYDQINQIFEIMFKQDNINADTMKEDLILAEWFVARHIKPTVAKIRLFFEDILNHMARFNMGAILTEEEKNCEKENLTAIFSDVREIRATTFYILWAMEKEISIE